MHLIVKNVHKYVEGRAGTIKILEGVNLEIKDGDFISIMGPSGTGKSTLLYMLGCLDLPTFGKIYMDDVEVSAQPEGIREKFRLHKVGFIFQNYNLLQTLSVLENVMLPMQLANSFRMERVNRSLGLLRIVDLEERALESVGSLSGGQQQRVAIARALSNAPTLILADEPTGNLDAKTGKSIMQVIRTINETQRISIVLVTHDPKVASYSKKIYYLEEGKLTSTTL